MDFYTVFNSGSQVKVESLMFRIAKPESYLMPTATKQQKADKKPTFCRALNLDPKGHIYSSPVVVLDFQSLYPSIMIAYNYCFSTCLGKLGVGVDAGQVLGVVNYKRPPGLLNEIGLDEINGRYKFEIPYRERSFRALSLRVLCLRRLSGRSCDKQRGNVERLQQAPPRMRVAERLYL